MEQLIPMVENQRQSVEAVLAQIGMQRYLPRFQMIVNGISSPAETLSLLGVAYNIGYSEADEAGRAKLKAIQGYLNGLGSNKPSCNGCESKEIAENMEDYWKHQRSGAD